MEHKVRHKLSVRTYPAPLDIQELIKNLNISKVRD